jgi:cephalosporin-C deacetylase-like acetyl esterase
MTTARLDPCHRLMTITNISLLAVLVSAAVACAQEAGSQHAFLEFIRAQAAEMRKGDRPPATLSEWEQKRAALRQRLEAAWGAFPAEACPLQPQGMGTLQRDGYRVEKIVFQTLPGVWMTANAYVPNRSEKVPAVLCVHGHWRGAKQDPVVQARCIGLAKLGFFVLSVDAFGAGERGLTKALGEYHGEMVAATLFPAGLSLCGLQVYENSRAVDYLLTRPEVDGRRLGITGCSGGGNQTMYAGAWDERFSAVVPVCSVGNYQAYLGAACCMCEVVPGALRFTEEWGVLAMTAPRALRVINATRDAVQFSVEEARNSLALTRPVYALHGREASLDHAVFEAPHDYNQEMRESMYGWMARFLKDSGDGSPMAEPDIQPEDPEALRCYPGDTRPDDFTTIPRFAAAQARRLVEQRRPPSGLEPWQAQRDAALQGLARCLFGGEPPRPAPGTRVAVTSDDRGRTINFEPEPGLMLSAHQRHMATPVRRLAIVLDFDGAEKAAESELAVQLGRGRWSVVTLDLRATGKLAYPRDKIGRAVDHNTAEWSLWIGRPLLGQWVIDVRRLLDALMEHDGRLPDEILLAGVGPAGLVAVCTAAMEPRISHVAALDMLASFVTDVPYEGQRLGTMVPGILRDAGDVAHLAALVAPRRLIVGGGVAGSGRPLDPAALAAAFAFPRRVYEINDAAGEFQVLPDSEAAVIVQRLK